MGDVGEPGRRALDAGGWAAMSANIDLVWGLVERWNDGDRSSAVFAEHCDPAIELESPLSSVSGEPYRGLTGIERWLQDLDEQFSEWRLTLEEVREVDDRVLAIGKVSARGRASDIALEFRSALVGSFGTDRRVTRARIYADIDDALADLGLEG
jgi:SnoaL-like domain